MDMELVTEGVAVEEDPFVPDDTDNDYQTLEGERCGICMDVVVDRGVLDCCQHWFCFACIDNWASITNLCPLCQGEFQLITCVPVYDTVGSSLDDEDLYSRDDDWCVEGKNSNLSFPSYYIDENAVVCLEGDDCKIRSESANIAEDSNLDTSIACDSCDIWYHAFCVGFDPDGSSEDSWLCPRCFVASTPKKSDEHEVGNSANEGLVEAGFSRKVSVSVADTGETAVVVSMIEGNQQKVTEGNHGNEEPSKILLPNLDIIKEQEFDALASMSDVNCCDMETALNENTSRNTEAGEQDLSLPQQKSSSLPSHFSVAPEVRGLDDEPYVPDKSRTSSGKLFVEHVKKEPLEYGFNLQLGLSTASSSSAENVNHPAEDHVTKKMQHKSSFKERGLLADKTQRAKECSNGLAGAKRKQRDYRSTEDRESKVKMQQHNVSAKKVKAERSSRIIHVKEQTDELVSDGSRISSSLVVGSQDGNLRSRSRKDHAAADIREIVQGTSGRTLRRKSSKEGEIAAGLRVKKIMRRPNEDNESAMVVQNLRKEIRDAIRNKSSNDLGNNVFDPKLLDAFRAVVAGTTEIRRPPPLDLKAKKLLLQKGRIRENLTKKIYGIGGKRKRAWTRDCEIEFWKHRCLKVSKPEKIETLKSVLNLLRKSPEKTEIKQENDSGPSTSILSRLYLADASVCPRKDDIKPLSALRGAGTLEQNKGPTFTEKACTSSPADSSVPVGLGVLQSIKSESASTKVHASKNPEQRSSKSTSGGSPSNSQNGTVGKADLRKIDKRKWALEVLARKSTILGKNAGEGEGDNAVLRGNFPLLAQLPADMRPVLAPCRHNKIPLSTRQTQLHRLTEHFLRKTNLPVTRRTAEIELAVVDAVNVEKEIADRSSSKLVYVNLCSQALLHKPAIITSATASDSTPSPTSPDPNDQLKEATNKSSSLEEVDEALRNAGLLSDSPPSSPSNQMEDANEKSEIITGEGPDNVFEIDAQPELDIYGDFEYDLEDDDFIGASAINNSKVEPEESKIKVVFSTLDSSRLNGAWNFEDHEAPESVGPTNPDNLTDKCPLQNSSLGEGGEEPLLEECEELYGPDKEPLISKFQESASLRPFEMLPNNIDHEGNEGQRSNLAEKEPEVCSESCSDNLVTTSTHNASSKESSNRPEKSEGKEKKARDDLKNQSDRSSSVFKKVESYIKEHVRPLCKSGVITVEQYRWAVGKTTEKIMKYHSKDTNANFLIREGEKVKKLAEQYVETAQKVEKPK